jgi:elongation factor G
MALEDKATVRNIGISAHIDSGKTTLTERILFYTNKIHRIGEVRGKDGVGATMDSMELEKERGITIASAATYCEWQDHHVNIIDTPGHVDFTVEVERALRVLDGAILVLCSVAGVQSQSLTVDRQMRRYNVPRIAFVNKCDRSGANPRSVTRQLREQLGHNAVMVQIPIGLEEDHEGVVDLVRMEAITFTGDQGMDVVRGPIPESLLAEAEEAREVLLDAASMFSDELMEAILEGDPTVDQINEAIRAGTLKRELTPVMMGSAYKNKGVQPLMDAVVDYLPAPTDIVNEGVDTANDEQVVTLETDDSKPTTVLAFKIEDGRYGQLTYIRVYQGTLKRDDTIFNMRSGKKHRVGRLVRMHADEMEELTLAGSGDIVGIFGLDCHSGDSFTDGRTKVALTSMHVPEPVIALSVKPKDSTSEAGMSKALQRFSKEDPTFRVTTDPESGETIIQGMGELHLEVYIERMRREYNANIETSAPQVAYRETLTKRADFNYLHKKQTGGSGQYAGVSGYIEPCEEEDFEFLDKIRGGSIPREYISSVEKGFKSALVKGPRIGAPMVHVRVCISDGQSHSVDSSEMAFAEAARGAWREAVQRAAVQILEPIMKVSVEGPSEHSGGILATLTQRRGNIIGTTEMDGFSRVDAEVPLSEMFGYSTILRSATQGKAEFSMEFAAYAKAPQSISEDLMEKARQAAAA